MSMDERAQRACREAVAASNPWRQLDHRDPATGRQFSGRLRDLLVAGETDEMLSLVREYRTAAQKLDGLMRAGATRPDMVAAIEAVEGCGASMKGVETAALRRHLSREAGPS